MPFVSFDMVSYAAGLTRLQFWRFALATLAGLLPASFVLAHLGSQITETATGGTSLAVIGLGLLTGAPLIWLAWKRKMPVGSSDHELSQINATDPSGPKLLENGETLSDPRTMDINCDTDGSSHGPAAGPVDLCVGGFDADFCCAVPCRA